MDAPFRLPVQDRKDAPQCAPIFSFVLVLDDCVDALVLMTLFAGDGVFEFVEEAFVVGVAGNAVSETFG